MTTSLAPGMQSTPMSFDGATTWQMSRTYTAAGNWSISFWIQTADVDGLTYVISKNDPNILTGIYINAAGQVGVNNLGAPTTYTVTPVTDNIPHHVVITAHSVNNIIVYVDNVASSTTPMAFFAITLEVIGNAGVNGNSWLTGTLQDVAVFDKALSALEVEGLYNRSRGFLQESSADRVTRLLDDCGWPALWREITTNPRASVGELIYNAAKVAPKIQQVVDSEQGMFFATKANYLALRERYYVNEVTVGNTVQQIFSDDGGATALPYSTFGFDFGELDVINDVTVTTPTTWAGSSDSASITANDQQARSVDTILTTFIAADAMADGLVAKGKDPTWRANPILVYPANNTSRWDEVLGLELGYRLQMEITPMAVGAQNAQEVTLEQIEWTITQELWSLTVAGSPTFGGASGTDPGWFIIGQSLIGGTDVIGY